MNTVFAIICFDKETKEKYMSGECYIKYEDAVKFIMTRSGKPIKTSDYCFDTEDISYYIKPLNVK